MMFNSCGRGLSGSCRSFLGTHAIRRRNGPSITSSQRTSKIVKKRNSDEADAADLMRELNDGSMHHEDDDERGDWGLDDIEEFAKRRSLEEGIELDDDDDDDGGSLSWMDLTPKGKGAFNSYNKSKTFLVAPPP